MSLRWEMIIGILVFPFILVKDLFHLYSGYVLDERKENVKKEREGKSNLNKIS